MVIQRSWRTSSQSVENSSVHQTSSSEDSNSSWHTVSNSTMSSHQNGSITTLSSSRAPNSEMAENVLKALRTRYNGRNSLEQNSLELAWRSMELMRLNVQDLFDKEIEKIVQKYIETYFKPALKNVRENIDDSGLTEDYLQKISCDLLENTKTLERASTIKSESKVSVKSEYDQSMYPFKTGPFKRKDSTSSSSELSSSDQSPKRSNSTSIATRMIAQPKQVFWNVANLTTDTLFVLDFKANRCLGFLEKERLTSLHPSLIRYLTDTQDKEWLIQQQILPPNYKNYRILLLVLDEIQKLAESDEYRNRTDLKLNELSGFRIPEFMLQKMKIFFSELTQRSQNLHTNTTLVIGPTATTSAPINAIALSTIRSSAAQVLIIDKNGIVSSPKPIMVTTATAPAVVASPTTTTNATATRTFLTNGRSSLSSSHATLSALLSTSNDH